MSATVGQIFELLKDIAPLKESGVGGFFVVSAVAGAESPYAAAKELADAWI